MHYNFIEIGTSNFNTLIESCSEEAFGLSIEPVKYYLDFLKDKKNVKKINAGVTHKKQDKYIEIFYIPESLILKNNLPEWFRGCNTIGKPHPLHIKHKVENLVVCDKVQLKNFNEIIIENNVVELDFLKIDTEGHDCVIMEGAYDFYSKNHFFKKPKKIQFESNEWTPSNEVSKIIKKFDSIGYKVVSRGYDTILEFKKE